MRSPLQCPSAQPNMPGAVIHGVVDAASGRVLPLESSLPVTDSLLASTAPLLPTQILRFSAACQESACGHYTGSACSLVTRLVQILPSSGTSIERCTIRPTCRWYFQEGLHACHRCTTIVTDEFSRTEALAALADPRGQA